MTDAKEFFLSKMSTKLLFLVSNAYSSLFPMYATQYESLNPYCRSHQFKMAHKKEELTSIGVLGHSKMFPRIGFL